MKYGPEGFNRIAILGTAGTSVELAPFKDESWSIWGCSPGLYPICAKARSNVWFEPHRWMPTSPGQIGAAGTKPWFSAEFHAFLREHKGPVYMTDPRAKADKSNVDELLAKYGPTEPSIPNSVPIPYGYLLQKYGPYFWSSTVSYMLVMAIEELAPRAADGEEVFLGLFGVDMAASEEYSYQRPGCQHWVGLAMSLGINVLLPQESDLMRPATMYGIGEYSPRHIRLSARRAEVQAGINILQAQHNEIGQRIISGKATLAELDYLLGTWSDDLEDPDLRLAVSFSGQYAKPVGALQKEAPESTGAAVVTLESKAG